MRGFNPSEGHSAISAVVIGALLAGTVAAATAPVVDWETPRPTPRTDTGDYSPFVNPQFTSARSLSETTSWLKAALEKYGDVPSDKYDPENSYHLTVIKFQDCSMHWLEHRLIDNNKAAIDHLYTLQLGDISLKPGELLVGTNSLTVGLSDARTPNPLNFTEHVYHDEDGALKSVGETQRFDNSFVLTLRNDDDIARRVGTALIHAARLCSTGTPQR